MLTRRPQPEPQSYSRDLLNLPNSRVGNAACPADRSLRFRYSYVLAWAEALPSPPETVALLLPEKGADSLTQIPSPRKPHKKHQQRIEHSGWISNRYRWPSRWLRTTTSTSQPSRTQPGLKRSGRGRRCGPRCSSFCASRLLFWGETAVRAVRHAARVRSPRRVVGWPYAVLGGGCGVLGNRREDHAE
jgi:hypothetical protein